MSLRTSIKVLQTLEASDLKHLAEAVKHASELTCCPTQNKLWKRIAGDLRQALETKKRKST